MINNHAQPQDIIAAFRAQRADLERLGVRHIALYGSRARGDARLDSDLDVLIDLDQSVAAGCRTDDKIARARAELAPVDWGIACATGMRLSMPA